MPSGTSHRPGWRWLAHSVGVLFLYLPLCPQRKFGPSPTPLRPLCGLGDWAGDSTNRNLLCPTKLARISLCRPTTPPGGRPVPLGTRKLELALQRPLAATHLSRIGHWPHAFSHTTVSKRRAARRLPPRRVRKIRFAHLRPRRRRTEKPLRPIVIVRAPCDSYSIRLTPK